MYLIKHLIFVFLLSIGINLFKIIKISVIKNRRNFFISISSAINRIYRLLNVNRRSEFVWKDLLKNHKNLNFGQFDSDQHIEISYPIEENTVVNFNYSVTNDKLICSAIILYSFDEEKTNDVLVLASHFNGLLSFGMVKVSIKYNYVEFIHAGDLVTYMLFSGEIDTDITTHYNLTKDCVWAFLNLLETGDDPVFVFSEVLKRKEENKKVPNSVELEE